jgi:hypothetical protein
MAQRRQEQVIGSQLAGLVVPYARELRDLGVDETFLREIAELTGGGSLDDPRGAFLKGRRQSRIAIDIWPWLVGVVGVMLLPEIALRRVGTGALGALTRRFRRRDDRAGTDGEVGR